MDRGFFPVLGVLVVHGIAAITPPPIEHWRLSVVRLGGGMAGLSGYDGLDIMDDSSMTVQNRKGESTYRLRNSHLLLEWKSARLPRFNPRGRSKPIQYQALPIMSHVNHVDHRSSHEVCET